MDNDIKQLAQERFTDAPSAQEPSSPINAWTEAENAAFAILCEATGHIAGVSAFIGEVTDVLNSFCFTNDAVQLSGEVFYAPVAEAFCLPYRAKGFFATRATAQQWAMKVMQALPVRGVGNIEHFRLSNNGIGALQLESVQFRNEVKERYCYVLELSFDLVIRIHC